MHWGKIALFAGGMLFGTAGLKVLGSKDAKKAYAHTTAAVLRMKDSVMTTVTNIRENADDVLADAKAINAARANADDECIEDCCDCCDTECCCDCDGAEDATETEEN